MKILCAVVQALMLPMLDARHHRPLRDGVACQFIGDQYARSDALLLEQLPQQTLGCIGIAPALNQDVEDGPC